MTDSESIVAGGSKDLSMSDDPMLDFFRRELDANVHLVIDQYGNRLQMTDEIARGGQGVVYRTTDADLAVKQPIGPNGRPVKDENLQSVFERIRCLPLPDNLPISLPVSILKSEPGYVMTLLNEMRPFSTFYIDGDDRVRLRKEPLPSWLEGLPSRKEAEDLLYYAQTGSTKRRLYALYKCAAIIARLHCAGLVYGDLSPRNAFISNGEPCEVWLIDADNLRQERVRGGQSVFSPHYGAPEVVRHQDDSRPYSDIWSFAVMSFEMITLTHPFIGRAVLDPEDAGVGWDSDERGSSPDESASMDLDDRAYMGYLPFIDDDLDSSNEGMTGLPRELVLTPLLRRLYQETLGVGRIKPWRRTAMPLWAAAMAWAHDHMVECPGCHMSYYADREECPYCDSGRPEYFLAKTERWSMVLQAGEHSDRMPLPHRLFNTFSLEHGDDSEYEASLDFNKRQVRPVRGTSKFPEGVAFLHVKGGR